MEETITPVPLPVELYDDSTTAISLATKTTSKSRVKHLELKYLKIKEYLETNILQAVKISSSEQLADCLPKGLINTVFLLENS